MHLKKGKRNIKKCKNSHPLSRIGNSNKNKFPPSSQKVLTTYHCLLNNNQIHFHYISHCEAGWFIKDCAVFHRFVIREVAALPIFYIPQNKWVLVPRTQLLYLNNSVLFFNVQNTIIWNANEEHRLPKCKTAIVLLFLLTNNSNK